jgi:hypothetical protein
MVRSTLLAAVLLFSISTQAFAQLTHSFPEFTIEAPGHELAYLNVTSTLGEPEPIVILYGLDGDNGFVNISATVPTNGRLSLPLNDQQLLTGSKLKVGFLRVTCETCKAQLVLRPRPLNVTASELARFWGNPLYINPVP